MVIRIVSLALATSVGFAAHAHDTSFEFRFSPNAGYSSYDGVMYGGDLSVGWYLTDHWQWKVGADGFGFTKNPRDNAISKYTGLVYNFSEDRARSSFVGAGLMYGNRERDYWDDSFAKDRYYGYLELGKRFKLNESGSWTWAPSVQAMSAAFDEPAVFAIKPLAFTYSF